MENTAEVIVSIIGLLLGGTGIGTFFTWRYQKKKAKAEAAEAETTAAKELQDLYQQMLADAKTDREDRLAQNEELRKERDRYKNDRNELRDQVEKLQEDISKWRQAGEEERLALKRQISQLEVRVDKMTPFMCGNLECKLRQLVVISDIVDGSKRGKRKKDIEPLEQSDIQ